MGDPKQLIEWPDLEAKLESWRNNGVSAPYLKPEERRPTKKDLEAMVTDSVVDATDGCEVEPDGYCEHGHVSWLIYLELI